MKLTLILPVWALLIADLSQAGVITIHDQTFTPGTWNVSILGGTNVTSASLTRLAGQGVTGDAQRTSISGSGSYTFDVQQFKTDRPFNPATEGSIQSINWEVWYRVASASQFAGWRLAARQGGATFVASTTYFEPVLFTSTWQRATGAIPVTAFARVTGSGSSQLDTSSTGLPIEFGYLLSRGVFAAGSTNYTASFYTLDITTLAIVPEPVTSFVVGLTTSCGLLVSRRRNKRLAQISP